MGFTEIWDAMFGKKEAPKPVESDFQKGVAGYGQTPPAEAPAAPAARRPVMTADEIRKLFPAVDPAETARKMQEILKILPMAGGGTGKSAKDLLDQDAIYAGVKSEIDKSTAAAKASIASAKDTISAGKKTVTAKDEFAPGSSPKLDAVQSFLAGLATAAAGLSGSPSVQRMAKEGRDSVDASNMRPFLDALAKDEIYKTPVGLSREAQVQLSDKMAARKKEVEAGNRDIDRVLAELDLSGAKLDVDAAKTLGGTKADLASKAAQIEATLIQSGVSAANAALAAKTHVLTSLFTQDRYAHEGQLRIALGLAGLDQKDNAVGQKEQQAAMDVYTKLMKEGQAEAANAYLKSTFPELYNRMMIQQGKSAVLPPH